MNTESVLSTKSESTSEQDSRKKLYHVYVSVTDQVPDPSRFFYSEDSGWEPDDEYDYEDAGAVYIGELTKKQYSIFQKEFRKLYKGQYGVGFWWEESYPPENLTSKVLLKNYELLTDNQKRALDIALHLANSIREADGCESRNVTTHCPKQRAKKTEKPIDKPPQKRKRESKYEELVRMYLEQLVDEVREGNKPQKDVQDLTPLVIAKHIKSTFKAKIQSVEQRVRKTKAWKNREKTFAPLYNTKTFENRQNTNTPYQRVQECDEDC